MNILIRFFTEDKAVAIVIGLNALVLFLLSFSELSPIHEVLNILDLLFLLYFIMEAILKIRKEGWEQYLSKSWNKFDFIIVLISLPSLLHPFFSEINDFTFVLLFRVVRVVRFFKFLRFVPNIDDLLAGIRRAFKASVFVLIVFLFICL